MGAFLIFGSDTLRSLNLNMQTHEVQRAVHTKLKRKAVFCSHLRCPICNCTYFLHLAVSDAILKLEHSRECNMGMQSGRLSWN